MNLKCNLRETCGSVHWNPRQESLVRPKFVQVCQSPLYPTVPYCSVTVSTQWSEARPAIWKNVARAMIINPINTMKSSWKRSSLPLFGSLPLPNAILKIISHNASFNTQVTYLLRYDRYFHCIEYALQLSMWWVACCKLKSISLCLAIDKRTFFF